MKKTIFFLLAAITCYAAHAQKLKEHEIPEQAKSALQKNYPSAQEVKWEKENDGYEASFKLKEAEYSIVVDQSGNITETEVEIKVDELPFEIMNYLIKNYPSQKVTEAARITKADGSVIYEAEMKNKELLFDATGKLLQEKVIKND